ncbi:endonuclease [Flavobacterium sp. UMI-01]|nr:endonuclease [Flavobacterium sp. UMI-01]
MDVQFSGVEIGYAQNPENHHTNLKDSTLNSGWKSYLPKFSKHQVIHHRYYSLSYNEQAEQAEWVAYELKKSYLKNNDFKRPYFVQDPKVFTQSADWRNYKNSGYDKGHLCPAGDMEFNLEAYNETFFTSNIAPQNREFNGGIWNRLENKVRYWAEKNNGIFVITGGVLTNATRTIGQEKVIVPDYFYKIIFKQDKDNPKIIAFLMPNEKSTKALYDYVVSVDAIEKITGIDFFPQLEDSLEEDLEGNIRLKSWIAH